LPALGIGLAFQGALRSFIATRADAFDFLEVVPDMLWTDRGPGRNPRYLDDQDGVALLTRAAERMPVVLHGIGLSIGSAHRFEREHVAQVARWRETIVFPWHSDHLAFHLAPGAAGDVNTGVTLPLPQDDATLDLLVARVAAIRAAVPVPFLLENNVTYVRMLDEDYDEPAFLNALAARSGCLLLLDLHNLYTNARNHRFDPYAFLDRLDLAAVGEIHVAGGMVVDGFHVDAHCDLPPPPVSELLEWVMPRCPNLGGVVFELFGSWLEPVGEAAVAGELARLRDIWQRRHAARHRVAA
jgi:uncharacterized protein (UPF0276 family)